MFYPHIYEYDANIAAKIHAIFDAATQLRSRNFFIRFDLRFPDIGYTYQENDLFSECMRVFIQHHKRTLVRVSKYDRKLKYGQVSARTRLRKYSKVFYLAVRERVYPSPSCHYHCFMLFDGNATRNAYAHLQKIQKIWNPLVGLPAELPGLVHYGRVVDNWWQHSWPSPQQCRGVMLSRNAPEFDAYLRYCLGQSMYLAKTYSKEALPAGVHRVFSTKLGQLGQRSGISSGQLTFQRDDDDDDICFG